MSVYCRASSLSEALSQRKGELWQPQCKHSVRSVITHLGHAWWMLKVNWKQTAISAFFRACMCVRCVCFCLRVHMRACVVCMFIQHTCHSLALTQACMGCVTQPLQSQGDRSHGDSARIKLHEGFQLFYVLAERKHISHSSSLLRAAMCGVLAPRPVWLPCMR